MRLLERILGKEHSIDEESSDFVRIKRVMDKGYSQVLDQISKKPVATIDPMQIVNMLKQIGEVRGLPRKYSSWKWAGQSRDMRSYMQTVGPKLEAMARRMDETIPLLAAAIGIEFGEAAVKGERQDLGNIMVMYSMLRKELGAAIPFDARIEDYRTFRFEYEKLAPSLEELVAAKQSFPETKGAVDRLAVKAKGIKQGLQGINHPQYPEQDVTKEIRAATELEQYFGTLGSNHEKLVAYRNSLVKGAQRIIGRMSELQGMEDLMDLESLNLVLSSIKDFKKPMPPIQTPFFGEEEKVYDQANDLLMNEISEKQGLIRQKAKEGYEAIRKEYAGSKPRDILELSTVMGSHTEYLDGLDTLAPLLSLLGETQILARVQDLRGTIASEMRQASGILERKGVLDADIKCLGTLEQSLEGLGYDITRYGINGPRLSKLMELESQLNAYEGEWTATDKYLAPAIGAYTSKVEQIQTQLEGAKQKSLERIDALVGELKEKRDSQGLMAAIQLYRMFPEGVEERIIRAEEGLHKKPKEEAVIPQGEPLMRNLLYFSGLIPSNSNYFRLVSALNGDMDVNHTGRLKTFLRLLQTTPPSDSQYDEEFMERLRLGVSLMSESPILKGELEKSPKDRGLVDAAISGIDAYKNMCDALQPA